MDRANFLGWVGIVALAGLGVPALFASASNSAPQSSSEGGWRLAEPVTYETLTLFPIISQQSSDTSAFLSLDEGLNSGEVVVSEQGADTLRRSRDNVGGDFPLLQSASVNQLVLINRSKRPLLLLAGELVSGGKQDRIIAKDRIVAPGAAPLPLDVFCVEHGRWSSGMQFSAGKMMVHPSVRERAAFDRQQSEVWSAVRSGTTSNSAPRSSGGVGGVAAPAPLSEERIQAEISSAAPTQAYQKIYNSPDTSAPINSFAEEVQKRFARATEDLKNERVIGVVVAYGGEVAWADAFASPELFERYWPKLVRSYAVEALARPQVREHASVSDAQDFLKPVGGRESSETEPGVYRWRSVSKGQYAEISLDALKPAATNLHWLKVHRTS